MSVFAALLVAGGCASEPTEPIDYAVRVNPASVVANAGQSVQFTASTIPASTNARWVWTSYDTSRIAVDSTGFARVLRAHPGGTVCAALFADITKKACAQFVIQAR
jgi:hypothetical protein